MFTIFCSPALLALLLACVLLRGSGSVTYTRAVFYSSPDCMSGSTLFSTTQSVADMAEFDMDNKAKSVRITGPWIFYAKAHYRDDDVQYAFSMNDECFALVGVRSQLSAFRFVGDQSDYRKDTLTLYENEYFTEQTSTQTLLTDDKPNIGMPKTSSLVITGQDMWQLYEKTNYAGNSICVIPPIESGVTTPPYFLPTFKPLHIKFNVRSARSGCIVNPNYDYNDEYYYL